PLSPPLSHPLLAALRGLDAPRRLGVAVPDRHRHVHRPRRHREEHRSGAGRSPRRPHRHHPRLRQPADVRLLPGADARRRPRAPRGTTSSTVVSPASTASTVATTTAPSASVSTSESSTTKPAPAGPPAMALISGDAKLLPKEFAVGAPITFKAKAATAKRTLL